MSLGHLDAAGHAWSRIAVGGQVTRLAYSDKQPTLYGARGYAAADQERLTAVSSKGSGAVALGGPRAALALPSAIASRATRTRTSARGSSTAAPDGRVLLHQAGYLARVGGSGPPQLITGPSSGLPYATVETVSVGSEVVIGHALVIYDGDSTVYTVDVS